MILSEKIMVGIAAVLLIFLFLINSTLGKISTQLDILERRSEGVSDQIMNVAYGWAEAKAELEKCRQKK